MSRPSRSYDEDVYKDPIQYMIWSCGLKATESRMAIAKALASQKQPISVADLHEIVKKIMPTISSSSVYRTLESLAEHGSVHRIQTGEAHACYEIVSGRKHHHHIICKK